MILNGDFSGCWLQFATVLREGLLALLDWVKTQTFLGRIVFNFVEIWLQ